jgi:hypothetical protein
VGTDANVYIGHWKAVTATKPQEVPLQVAARSIFVVFLVNREAEHVGLSNSPPQLAWRECIRPALRRCKAKVGDRSLRGRHRDRSAQDHVGRTKSAGAMHTNAMALRPATFTADDDVNRSVPSGQEIPKASCTAMAHRGPPISKGRCAPDPWATTDRQSCGYASSLVRQRRVTHRVDTAVQPVQPTSIDASPHAPLAEP